MIKKVAITGGIGSGKSFVCKIFKSLNVPIFDSDSQAKDLMIYDLNLIADLKREFGDDIYISDGNHHHVNRTRLAEIVFNDKTALGRLNGIVHPLVRKKFNEWVNNCEKNGSSYVLFESAIIFESGLFEIFDNIITVSTDLEVRIFRAMERDNISREKVLERINNQLNDDYRVKHSDFVIFNNENDLEKSYLDLIPQVFEIHQNLINS